MGLMAAERRRNSVFADAPGHLDAGADWAEFVAILSDFDRFRPSWQHEAACRGTPLEWWFQRAGGKSTQARAVCGRCPVFAECRAWAYSEPHQLGVLAGASAEQRRRWHQAQHPRGTRRADP